MAFWVVTSLVWCWLMLGNAFYSVSGVDFYNKWHII